VVVVQLRKTAEFDQVAKKFEAEIAAKRARNKSPASDSEGSSHGPAKEDDHNEEQHDEKAEDLDKAVAQEQ